MVCWSSILPGLSPVPPVRKRLADFGAEVIKIENPDGGDDTRHYEHAEIGGESAAFISLNRNKRGIALDFTNPAALEVARELIAKADVVVENFSGGVMKKYGLDYASVAPTNPRLIYCSISAYGRKGEFALAPGLRSDHAGGKRLHVAERLSGWRAGADRSADRRSGDGHVGLQRHPACAAGPRAARPWPACRGGVDRHRGGDDRLSTAWPI